jgi:hypothetical protein
LSFTEIHGSHTGERLSKYVLDVLVEFKLCEKLFCITSDNAGNMRKLMRFLSRRLRRLGVKWNYKENYINCMNHVLNLAVQVFLKKIKALPAKEVVVYEMDEDEDEDEDVEDDDDMEIDDDEGDGGDHIVLNPELVEEDADYDNISDDFQGTLKKLRGVAKVRDVAHKIPFALLPN